MFKVSPLGCGKHAVHQPGVKACLHGGGRPQVGEVTHFGG